MHGSGGPAQEEAGAVLHPRRGDIASPFVATLLFVSYSGVFGGAERVLLDWVPGLEGEICLACPEGVLAERARAAGMRVLTLRERRLELRTSLSDRLLAPARLIGHAREVRALVAALHPDLLIGWGMRSMLACTAAPAGAGPRVFQHNDLVPRGIAGGLVRTAATRCDLVIALSRSIADDLDPAGRMGKRLVVIHPGVDPGRFAPDEPPATPPEILVLGALVDWKRPDLAIEVLALARGQVPDLRLRFVGAPLGHGDPVPEALQSGSAWYLPWRYGRWTGRHIDPKTRLDA